MNQYPGGATAGRFLPEDPGEVVWADKSLSGVTAATLTAAQISNLEGNNCNHYTSTAGVGNLYKGWVASGEFTDIIRLSDWTVTTIQEELFALARANRKIPYTDKGVALIEGVVRNVLRRKMPLAYVDGSDTFDAPLVSSVSAVDKAARLLPDVTFGATFAGGIMTITVTANLSF